MSEILQSLGPLGMAAVLLLLKVALVVGIAGAISLSLRGASAGARHLVWTGAVLALLVLPALTYLLPAWELEIASPIERIAAAGSDGVSVGLSTTPAIAVIDPVDEPIASLGTVDVRGADAPSVAATQAPREVDWLLWFFVVWVSGTVLLLVRIFVGWWGLRGFSRDAVPVTNPEWLQLMKDARWLLDVERPVRLLQSGSASMPVTWGTLRPTVLLPAGASGWSEERLRMVLLHEVAHVARYDCLTQMLAGICCALYWFHPLSWVAARQLRVERERACDDRVLAAGERASEYASHLLEVARSFRRAAPIGIAAIAMARPSQLEGRLLAVLDTAKRRGTPGRPARMAGLAAAAVVIMPLAAAQAVAANDGAFATAESLDASDIRGSQDTGVVLATSDLPAAPSPPSTRPAPTAHPVPSGAATDSVIELRVAAVPGRVVSFNLESGARLEVFGWDRDEVSVQGQLAGDRIHDLSVELVPTTDGVRLVSRYRTEGSNRNSNIRFHVFVPRRSDVVFRSAGGDVALCSLSGSLSGSTGGGSLTLAEVVGHADLSTGGGNVEVQDSELDGVVTTGGGNISLARLAGGLEARTGGGNITISDDLAPSRNTSIDPSRWLQYTTGGGNISVARTAFPLDVSTGGGAIRIGGAMGGIRAETGGGAISITEASGGVSASTGSGRVSIDQAAGAVRVSSGSGAVDVGITPSASYADIDIESGSGTVTLTLPANFSGRFDIEASGGGRNGVNSDFPITLGPNGRATGQVGNGSNVVRVKTRNGSVTLRRAGAVAAVDSAPRTTVIRVNDNVNVNMPSEVTVGSATAVDVDAAVEHALRLADHTGHFDQNALDEFILKLGEFTARETVRGLNEGFRAAIDALQDIEFHFERD